MLDADYEEDAAPSSVLGGPLSESTLLDEPAELQTDNNHAPTEVNNTIGETVAEAAPAMTLPEPIEEVSLDPPRSVAEVAAAAPTATADEPTAAFQGVNVAEEEIQTLTSQVEELEITEETRSAPSGSLEITVTEPLKRVDASGGGLMNRPFVTYKVTTTSTIPTFSCSSTGHPIIVRRRFRDFVALADQLFHANRGYFIPPRPEKDVLSSSNDKDFIEGRRKQLEHWLQRLAAHPILRVSPPLITFLEKDGDFCPKDMASSMMAQSYHVGGDGGNKGGPDWLRRFREGRQSMVNNYIEKPPLEETDEAFLANKAKLAETEKQLSDASRAAEALINNNEDMVSVLADTGLSLIKLSKFQEVHNQWQSAGELKALGSGSVRMSRLTRSASVHSVKSLGLLHENLALLPGIQQAVEDRAHALLTLQTLITDIEKKKDRLAKLEGRQDKKLGGDTKVTRMVQELKQDLGATEEAKKTAQEVYATIQDLNAKEFERFEREKRLDMSKMLLDYVRTQVAFAERSATIWEAAFEGV
mmetsp:Transcript_4129/g.14781  ORF Transcript_4129/g.14781 Transcript_4129/m.14781 type:complete len:530 (+) Transcript_4129:284-1873(+)